MLHCNAMELRVSRTAEGLIELRLMRPFAARGPLSATLVGTSEQIDQWLNRKAVEVDGGDE